MLVFHIFPNAGNNVKEWLSPAANYHHRFYSDRSYRKFNRFFRADSSCSTFSSRAYSSLICFFSAFLYFISDQTLMLPAKRGREEGNRDASSREVCLVSIIIIILFRSEKSDACPWKPSLADPSDTIGIVPPLCIHPLTLFLSHHQLRCPPIICTRAPTNYFIRTFTEEGKCRRIDLFNLHCLCDAPVNVNKRFLLLWSTRENRIF